MISSHYLERAAKMAENFGGNGLTTDQQIQYAAGLLHQWAHEDGTEPNEINPFPVMPPPTPSPEDKTS